MSEMVLPKRKYVRIDQSTWSEIEAFWESGDVTLEELQDRYGVSRRALQLHFAKRKLVKGAKAAQIAAVVKEMVFSETLPDVDEVTQRAKKTREAAYQNAVIVEDLIMAQLSAAQKDPSQALKAASAIKALTLAAAGLERLHELKWKSLGLDKDSVLSDQMPVHVFEDLTEAEIEAMRERHGDAEEDLGCKEPACVDDEDDDELVAIDRDEPDSSLTAVDASRQTGPRLVRGAT